MYVLCVFGSIVAGGGHSRVDTSSGVHLSQPLKK